MNTLNRDRKNKDGRWYSSRTESLIDEERRPVSRVKAGRVVSGCFEVIGRREYLHLFFIHELPILGNSDKQWCCLQLITLGSVRITPKRVCNGRTRL